MIRLLDHVFFYSLWYSKLKNYWDALFKVCGQGGGTYFSCIFVCGCAIAYLYIRPELAKYFAKALSEKKLIRGPRCQLTSNWCHWSFYLWSTLNVSVKLREYCHYEMSFLDPFDSFVIENKFSKTFTQASKTRRKFQ